MFHAIDHIVDQQCRALHHHRQRIVSFWITGSAHHCSLRGSPSHVSSNNVYLPCDVTCNDIQDGIMHCLQTENYCWIAQSNRHIERQQWVICIGGSLQSIDCIVHIRRIECQWTEFMCSHSAIILCVKNKKWWHWFVLLTFFSNIFSQLLVCHN